MSERCPVCGGRSSHRFSVGDLNRQLSSEVFDYHECDDCETLFLSPVPGDLSRYYPSEYYGFRPTREALAAGVGGERYKIDLVREFVPRGRILEIGPGAGGFAYLATEAGFDVEVLEMDAASAEYLRAVVGVRAIHAEATPDVLANMPRYDVVALWHVIEHVPNPLDLLDALVERLEPNGILIIATPNPRSFQLELFGPRWTHVDAPRHQFLLPANVLIDRAVGRGLTLRLATTNDPGGLDWNAFGWRQSLRHVFPFPIPFVFNAASRILTTIARPWDRRPMRGSAYTLVFSTRET